MIPWIRGLPPGSGLRGWLIPGTRIEDASSGRFMTPLRDDDPMRLTQRSQPRRSTESTGTCGSTLIVPCHREAYRVRLIQRDQWQAQR